MEIIAPLILLLAAFLVKRFQRKQLMTSIPSSDFPTLVRQSTPFVKHQWPFILLCASSPLIAIYFTHLNRYEIGSQAWYFTCIVILFNPITPALKLFYACYLNSTDYAIAFAAIDTKSLFKYVMLDLLRLSIAYLALGFLIYPGIRILIRTCLLLPAYVICGNRASNAVADSTSLTKHRELFIINRFGFIPLIYATTSILSIRLLTELFSTWHSDLKFPEMTLGLMLSLSTVLLDLHLTGTSFQIYTELNAEAVKKLEKDNSQNISAGGEQE